MFCDAIVAIVLCIKCLLMQGEIIFSDIPNADIEYCYSVVPTNQFRSNEGYAVSEALHVNSVVIQAITIIIYLS